MSNDEYSRILLDEYKKYDYLNQHKETQLIKILVSYIKPSFLFKSNILTPIHLGRAVEKENSKDGAITDKDIKWLHENCIGDDDFEGNISHVNRRVGFLTGTYWAWKNYEKLGNPEYFGSFGYRRLLPADYLANIEKYDFILPEKTFVNDINNKACLVNAHGEGVLNETLSILTKLYGISVKHQFENYLNLKNGYYFELYILKKHLFFEFCNWIFPIFFELLKNIDKVVISSEERMKIIAHFEKIFQTEDCNENNFEMYQIRSIGFIIERLTGFYLYRLTQCNMYKYCELNPFIPNSNNIIGELRNRLKKGGGINAKRN